MGFDPQKNNEEQLFLMSKVKGRSLNVDRGLLNVEC
jgi:hypothetical protein